MPPAVPVLQSTVNGLKSAANLAINISKLHTMTEVQAKTIELQQIILTAQRDALMAQAEQSDLLQEIDSLKKELAGLKAWGAEKENYKLANWKHGVLAYIPKDSVQPSEADHALCATCFDNGRKSILQAVKVLFTHNIKCGGCGSETTVTK